MTTQQETVHQYRLWKSIPLFIIIMILGLFIGTVLSASFVGMNKEVRIDIRVALNLEPASNPSTTDSLIIEATSNLPRAGIGANIDPGGYILLELSEVEHFFYTNVESNPVFTDVLAEVIAYGDEFRLINDVDNLISFSNVETEIQQPGAALELLMRSLYEVLNFYNNTGEPYLPCVVLSQDEDHARQIRIQLRVPPGEIGKGIVHQQPYIQPIGATDKIDVTCYFPSQ